jgi:hypothetical protein
MALISKKRKLTWETHQRTLFQSPPDPIREALGKVDPNRLTPLDALNILSDMKSRLSDNEWPRQLVGAIREPPRPLCHNCRNQKGGTVAGRSGFKIFSEGASKNP